MIQLHSLHLSRFRGVREGAIQGLTNVNILVGRNNSGKTTIAEAIMRLANRVGGTTDYLGRGMHHVWGIFRNEGAEYPPELWYKMDQAQPAAVVAKLIVPTPKRVDIQPNCSFSLTIEAALGSIEAVPTYSTEKVSITNSDGAAFLRRLALFRPQDATNQAIEDKFWTQLLANRRDKTLTRVLNEVYGLQAEGLQLLPDKRLMVLFENHSLPLDVQGDGNRAALRALIVLSMLKETVFLLEEPECHQHPGALERFATALCRLAQEQEVQLILSTHSDVCVKAFLQAASSVAADAAVFHLTLTEGIQQARRLDARAVETLQATGVDVRFLDLYE